MAKPRHDLRRKRSQVELALFTGAPASAEEVRKALGPLARELGGDEPARVEELARVAEGSFDRDRYRETHGVVGVRRFRTAGGATIYLLPIETFPDHVNNVYLVREGARVTLYDCGSQTALSQDDLRRAGLIVKQVFGERAGLDDVTDVIVSHAHIDHFGGVGAFSGRAPIYAHEFDARVVSRFEERIVTAALQLRVFLERAGVADAVRHELEQMYVFTKQLFVSVPIDRTLTDGAQVNGYACHHVPGHCPGQICLQVHNVLLTADHILPRITPHQSPESITPWTGLDHYFRSLEKIRHVGGIDFALPGHEEPILRLAQRIQDIEDFHQKRLDQVLAFCEGAPRTTAEISSALFGEQMGYGRLLALEEAAAHAEYLSRRAALKIANLDELVRALNPPLRYRAALRQRAHAGETP